MEKESAASPAEGATEEVAETPLSSFEKVLNEGFRPKSEDAEAGIKNAVQVLAEHVLKGTAQYDKKSDDTIAYIEQIKAEIDRRLTKQMNAILHHEKFQKLESSWRGLHHLVNQSETSTMLKIKVLNITKTELRKNLKTGTAWDQSPIFKKLYEEEFGTPGGQPYGCLIGDFDFSHKPADVHILREMAKVAAAAHAPFIAAAHHDLLNLDSWQDLSKPRDLKKIVDEPEYRAWKSLRESEDSRYLGLTMPRFLARVPYGEETAPIDSFAFEEEADGDSHKNYCWANSAYAYATNLNRSFSMFSFCTCIRGLENGGIVDELPFHTFPTDDGKVDMKCPTEIAITDRRENELGDIGLLPLSHYKNTDYAVFFGGQSLQDPKEYHDKAATANAALSARLPYLFASCRFAHYLKCMVRDKVGTFANEQTLKDFLTNWIMNYVNPDPRASAEHKATHPLSAASVEVTPNEENPGEYNAVFHLAPHFQLEALTASLKLVSKVQQKS